MMKKRILYALGVLLPLALIITMVVVLRGSVRTVQDGGNRLANSGSGDTDTKISEEITENADTSEKTDIDENKVWLLTKKTYSNGQYTLYTYEDNGGQLATRYAADGRELGIESKYSPLSENDYETLSRSFDDAGNVTSYNKSKVSKRNVTDSGYELEETCYYNPNSDDVSGYIDVTYEKCGESDVMTGYKSYSLGGGDGRQKVLSAYMKAEINDKGQTTRSAYYDGNDVLTSESLSTFDAKGNEKENTFISYANDGSVQNKSVTKSEYDGPNGSLSKKVQYNESGAKVSDTVYEYDKYGNVIKETVTAADGLVTWTQMEYR